MTESWVYLFSKFTPEALLFEALGIFVLSGVYAGYWIMKKRRIGAAGENDVPAGVVRGYLNELIQDAEQMRAQLFGLLRGAQLDPSLLAAGAKLQTIAIPSGDPVDPALAAKLQALEGKMAEQAKMMDSITAEKERIAAELVKARAAAQSASAQSAGSGASSADIAELTAKLQNLEAKLAEYSIIEDDLANLKRLQQENAQLRGALASAGVPVPASAEPARPAPEAPKPAVAQAPAPAPEPEPVLAAAAAPEPEPVVESTSPLDSIGGSTAAFEAVVDNVEQSLQKEPEPLTAAAPNDTPKEAAAPAAPVVDKSDADLVAEFEKMLSG